MANPVSNATPAAVSAAPAAQDGLRDIVDAIPVVDWWQRLLYGGLALLALGLLAWFAWRWWRARQERLSRPEPPPPPLPPHLWAARELDYALRLLGDPDAFCTEVSRILREYLERRFGWNAPDRTTEEFLGSLRAESTFTEDQRRTLGEFLAGCDLVKFARHDPTETELRELHTAALLLVSETTPSAVYGTQVPGTATTPDAPSK
ncbi:MAG: hypothetical protein IT580_22180 [Verrucomicrobiales bacterium]|nr:hypothetical protein [Verrucomicrobiales bacterium]